MFGYLTLLFLFFFFFSPIVRINDGNGALMCTIVIDKEQANSFNALRAQIGESIALGELEQVEGCRLVTGAELEVELTQWEQPILLDCFARWCGPCQLMVPVMDQVAKRLASRCRVLKLDTDEDPAMADYFRVQGLPTLLFLNVDANGSPKVIHRFEGAAPVDHVIRLAEHHFFGGPAPRDVSALMS